MKILLVSPSHRSVYGKLTPPEHPHLGLGYVAAALVAAGHGVRLIDIDAERLTDAGLAGIFRAELPELVGVTATTPLFGNAVEIAALAKEHARAATVIGGIHATLVSEECVASPAVDFAVVGEGEETVVELVRCLEGGGDVSGVRGLVHKRDGAVVRNEPRPPIADLDALPFPARHLYRNQAYTYPDALRRPTFPIITSRGCPGNCTYCTAKFIHGRKFRARSAANVLDEIELLVREYGAREIHVWDDNFITHHRRVFEFRDGVKARKLDVLFSFPNGVRADFITEDVLQALRDFGTYSIAIGVESGNQRVLDSVQKGVKLERIEQAFAIAKRLGLETWGFFLLGLPGETPETLNDTIEFALKLNPDIAKFHILMPYPGSVVHGQLKAEGLLLDENFVNYRIHASPVHRLPTVSAEELLRWQQTAYRRFYLRPSKILSEIRRLKSFGRLTSNIAMGFSLLKTKVFS